MTNPFPYANDVKTPLGPAEHLWSTSETHIGMRGEFRVNGVDYNVRIDMFFRDGIWQLGSEDTNSSRWDCFMVRRANWDYLRGRCPDPSASARTKISDTLIPWLAEYALTHAGQAMINAAGQRKRERAIQSAKSKIESLRNELVTAERELIELQVA